MAGGAQRVEARGEAERGRRRGRPAVLPEAVRRARLVEAAEAIFLERGYAEATMDDVAQQAGMSKKTLYQLFDGKSDLFRALLRTQMGPTFSALPDATDRREMGEILVTHLTRFTELVVSPRQVAMMRLVVSEAHRVPELAEAFRREAFETCPEEFVRWLSRMKEKGLVFVEDVDEAVEMLFGAAIGGSMVKLLASADLAADAEVEKAAMKRRIRRAVAGFLDTAGAAP